ncbi:MAG: aminotransferase class V-fold PLP-dependent enzyme, partial [Pseudomonadota bacterium]
MTDAVRQTAAEDWDARANALDAGDPLAQARALFDLPDGVVYLDGNSLGPLPKTVPARLNQAVQQEWRTDLIRSWNTAGWIDLPAKIGEKIGTLIGAEPQTVVAADSTSTNVFKVLSGALALRPDRRKIISERQNFPTDLYMAEGVIGQLGQGHELVLIDSPDELPGTIDDQTAVVMLTHVNYRSGAMFDIADVTALAHRAGALTVWDLAHSAGAVPVDLSAANADFAIGCGYKFLNGGPGAPAFLYVAPKHQEKFNQPLSGWMGHAAPFAFESSYRPAEGISRALCGTPPVLAMAALDAAMDIWQQVSMAQVRAKSIEQCAFFIEAVENHCAGH